MKTKAFKLLVDYLYGSIKKQGIHGKHKTVIPQHRCHKIACILIVLLDVNDFAERFYQIIRVWRFKPSQYGGADVNVYVVGHHVSPVNVTNINSLVKVSMNRPNSLCLPSNGENTVLFSRC